MLPSSASLAVNAASGVQVPHIGLIEQSCELFDTFIGAREGASAESGLHVLRT